jgi:uncharacterized protein YgfB (UPF0149 family)
MSQLRAILLQANLNADYSQPQLLEQAQQVNVDELHRLAGGMLKRASIIAHAVDVMNEGTHTHPMQAILHATECMALNEERLSDDEFYAVLALWGALNEKAQRANTATDVSPGAASQQAFNLFAERFMRGE